MIERALALAPHDFQLWMVKAVLFAELLRYHDALLAVNYAQTIKPDDPSAQMLRAQLEQAQSAGLMRTAGGPGSGIRVAGGLAQVFGTMASEMGKAIFKDLS